ncbi:MAG: hypothetical protein ACREYC_16995 [Gammaproteobacteria bacterium]
MIAELMKPILFRALYGSWGVTDGKPHGSGYSALLPVPADLPVFLQIALKSLMTQDQEHLAEVLVLPDIPSQEFRAVFEKLTEGISSSRIRLIEMSGKDMTVARLYKTPNVYYFLQILNGIRNARSTHVLLHDADLFLFSRDFLRRHYEECLQRCVSVLGVDRRSITRLEECRHIVATWEMIATVEWAMRFKPHEHRGHRRLFRGRLMNFDSTLLPQFLTDPREIGINEEFGEDDYVHFNFVISVYRLFRKFRGRFEDEHFKLLLIRSLIDALGDAGWTYSVPSMTELVNALDGKDDRVSYIESRTRKGYEIFRRNLERLRQSGILGAEAGDILKRQLIPFDERFVWMP